MKVRRVVTGHKTDGKATFASDTEVDGITFETMPGLEFHRLACGIAFSIDKVLVMVEVRRVKRHAGPA